MGKFWKDAGERLLWTLLEAVVATAGVYAADLPVAYIPVATAVVTTIKVLVARHVGNHETAALAKE